MKIIYRISDTGYKKIKPSYINNENCIKNFFTVFQNEDILILADNICQNTYKMINKYATRNNIEEVSIGHGAGTFNLALDKAILLNDNEIVYFVENDYLHRINSPYLILDGFNIGADFVTLYDHPDKYLDPKYGGNKYCHGGAENTRVYLGQYCHWKLTNSTTMTFASKVNTLKKTEMILRKWTSGNHPYDFDMFLELQSLKYSLVSPIPGYSTHGETQWLCPFTDWSSVLVS